MASVKEQNKMVAKLVKDGNHSLLPFYVSNWWDAWLFLLTDCGRADMKQYCMQCMHKAKHSCGFGSKEYCKRKKHTSQRAFFSKVHRWRNLKQWVGVSETYEYYDKVFA